MVVVRPAIRNALLALLAAWPFTSNFRVHGGERSRGGFAPAEAKIMGPVVYVLYFVWQWDHGNRIYLSLASRAITQRRKAAMRSRRASEIRKTAGRKAKIPGAESPVLNMGHCCKHIAPLPRLPAVSAPSKRPRALVAAGLGRHAYPGSWRGEEVTLEGQRRLTCARAGSS
jgi:hypothetical protein